MKCCIDFGLEKTQWTTTTNTSRWHRAPTHHRLRKSPTGSSPFFLQNSRPFISKWDTKFTFHLTRGLPFCNYLTHVTHFWCCLLFRSGTAIRLLSLEDTSAWWLSMNWTCHSSWLSPRFLNWLLWLWSHLLFVHVFPPHSTFHYYALIQRSLNSQPFQPWPSVT